MRDALNVSVAKGSAVARRCLPVFHPERRFKMGWNMLIMLLVLTSAVMVPLTVAFDTDFSLETQSRLAVVDYVFDAIFIGDLLISFNTGYVKDGLFVTDRWLVARHYLHGFFFLDLISSFPLGLIMSAATAGGGGAVSRLNRLLRLVRLMKLLRLFKFTSFLKAPRPTLPPAPTAPPPSLAARPLR